MEGLVILFKLFLGCMFILAAQVIAMEMTETSSSSNKHAMSRYNFKKVPIINEGYYYDTIERLKHLLEILLLINLFYSVIFSDIMVFFIGSVVLVFLFSVLHDINFRARKLIDVSDDDISKLSQKEMGDLWVEAYKREMLAINPNVFSEPKKTDFEIPIKVLSIMGVFAVSTYAVYKVFIQG